MKIAFFSKELPSNAPNGVSCQVHRLANALVNLGQSVTCYSFSPAPVDAQYKVITLCYKSRLSLIKKITPAFMFRNIDSADYDILHYHGDDYLCKGGYRRVRTFYGSAFYEALHARNLKRFLYQALFYLFELVSCIRKGKKLGISRTTARVLPVRMSIIPCGVSCANFCTGKWKTDKPSLLFIGDIDSRKRGRLMASIFTQSIIPCFPNATMTVVGPQKIEDSGIINAGRIPEKNLIELFQRSWIYCCVSSYEGFGAPVIESMACKTAVLAITNGGSREIITHEHDGLLCTAETFPRELVRLISNNALRKRLMENALQTAKKYDIDSLALSYIKTYSSCYGKTDE